jgi:hypothetical protein
MGPYAGVDYNLTLCPLRSQLHGTHLPLGNPGLESTLTLCQSRLYPPVRTLDLAFVIYSLHADVCSALPWVENMKRVKIFAWRCYLAGPGYPVAYLIPGPLGQAF